ncbi:MAG: preprotein translocase subunit SecE [Candidatus Saccharimonadales bacterium]
MTAQPAPGSRKRIRKSAPTVRERVEAARMKAEQPKKRPLREATRPLRRIRRPQNRFTKGLAAALRPIGRVLRLIVPSYFANAWREVRQVSWPNRRETWRLTFAVFIFAVIFGSLVYGVDKVLGELFQRLILR